MADDIVKRLRRFERYGKYDLLGECWPERIVNPDGPEAADEIERLRADVERLTRERDEARGNAETFRNSMYSLEERVVELTREKGEALNELDTIYGALGTADAEGAPDAAASIGGLFDRAEAAERKVEKLREALCPFAAESDAYDPDENDAEYPAWDSRFKIGDLRRARATLAETEKE